MALKVLGLITARGGSKGIPHKNIRLLAGKPLLQYTAEAALESSLLSKVILSTEDEEIAKVGRECGLDVPFQRPAELAQDDTPTLPVVQQAIGWMEEHGESYDAICLLQPTNPFRQSDEIDACIELFEERDADSVITVLPVPAEYNPHWIYESDRAGLLHLCMGGMDPLPRRQDLPAAFHREGSVYVIRRDVVMDDNSLYGWRVLGYEMQPERSVNIDSEDDWERAEDLLKRASIGSTFSPLRSVASA